MSRIAEDYEFTIPMVATAHDIATGKRTATHPVDMTIKVRAQTIREACAAIGNNLTSSRMLTVVVPRADQPTPEPVFTLDEAAAAAPPVAGNPFDEEL